MPIANAYCPICGSQSVSLVRNTDLQVDDHVCGNGHKYRALAATATPQTTKNPKLTAIDPRKPRVY